MPPRAERRRLARDAAKRHSHGNGFHPPADQGERLVRLMDELGYAGMLRVFNESAKEKGDYAGLVFPNGRRAALAEPRPSWAPVWDAAVEPEPDREPALFLNRIHGWGGVLTMYRTKAEPDVGRGYLKRPPVERLYLTIQGLGDRKALLAEAELRALPRLLASLSAIQAEQYILSGCFLERSERSGVCYLFRRGLPVVALRVTETSCTVLCALCSHALGYFEDSPAGLMPPSDDVLTLLLMMRADETYLWRKCVQHDIRDPRAMV